VLGLSRPQWWTFRFLLGFAFGARFSPLRWEGGGFVALTYPGRPFQRFKNVLAF
jgi:hypothetical protein